MKCVIIILKQITKVSHIVFVVVLNQSTVAYSLPGELVYYVCLHIVEFSVDLIQF